MKRPQLNMILMYTLKANQSKWWEGMQPDHLGAVQSAFMCQQGGSGTRTGGYEGGS